jgi:uncharacterized membrane protein YbhN (UPF0104 family)
VSKKILKLLLKLILTVLALYLVIRKIDVEVTWQIIKSANGIYLLSASLFYILSKVFSSFRLNYFFKDLGLQIPTGENIKLYGIGMYYNLFLPGGIGGDGYKVYLLNKWYKAPIKQLLQAVLLDRLNGVTVLVFLMLVLILWVDIDVFLSVDIEVLAGVAMLLLGTCFYGMMRIFFRSFTRSMWATLVYSFLVQMMQLVCSFFILKAIGVNAQIIEYQFVFLLSSVVAVLPLTLGGVGARELVFLFSHDYMGIDKNSAVAFSLIFFLITALTSLVGVFLKFKPNTNPIH